MQQAQLEHLLDILMAMAASDGQTDPKEATMIIDRLMEVGDASANRATLVARQASFDRSAFKLSESIAGLGSLKESERHEILRAIEHVEEADGVIHLDEESFLRQVGRMLGFSEDVLDAMTVTIIHDGPQPPPLKKQ